MRSLLKIALLLTFVSAFFSCKSDDGVNSTPIRDFQEVYDEDIVEIEEYLKTNYLELDANLNATVTKIPEDGTQTSIWDQTAYPLQSITVKNDVKASLASDYVSKDQVDYKLYYILLNEGGGTNPITIDSTLVSYKGWNLVNEVFDQNNVGLWFSYPDASEAISGFRQILTKMKTAASSVVNSDGSVSYVNAGNLIVFIPSGLAYFNSGSTYIASYSPIAFQIRLLARKERDHERDRVLGKYEDTNGDGDFFNDDLDGDRVPNFLDVDDDGDGTLTKYEVRFPVVTGTPPNEITTYYYYPFNGAATDDPLTPYDDRKGIPSCSNDYLSPTRLRRHLDSSCR
ncbi:FKBP-type peptidyl-prolyl cis-trans isomerase [Flavobacterium proteolyticum]|uniref:Peptidylprolyl isomerase n=1 Tax=Flavobacterium proteolyticum TaxID=2911683 RepID=A0ABR9WUS0_9FLAO|nr:hypothetical protein [Flavobacterium proteolyticum]MBE9577409.1 hypothetical protein [Flavobacterium proteolyticum]